METSPAAPASEPDLIRRAREGFGPAWEALMRAHQEPVFRFAYLLLGDADEAEDAAQETFIRAYSALERFDLDRPLRPWLLAIAANLARNRRRSVGRYLAALNRFAHHADLDAAGQGEALSRSGLEELSAQRMQAETLWRAVQRLEEASRQVIYLRFFLGLPVEETAQALDVAEGTVKSRLHRALQRLKRVIEQEYPGLLQEAGFEVLDEE